MDLKNLESSANRATVKSWTQLGMSFIQKKQKWTQNRALWDTRNDGKPIRTAPFNNHPLFIQASYTTCISSLYRQSNNVITTNLQTGK